MDDRALPHGPAPDRRTGSGHTGIEVSLRLGRDHHRPRRQDPECGRLRHARPGTPGRRAGVTSQRLAVESDAASIAELMRISVLELFPRFYDEQQTASAAVHIAHLDMQLINDGTYFVHEANGELVACGGWSRRNKLYSGPGDAEDDDRLLDPKSEPARVRAMFVRSDFTRRGIGRAILESCERAARDEGFKNLVLGATFPGEPLYRAFGFREVERLPLRCPTVCRSSASEWSDRLEGRCPRTTTAAPSLTRPLADVLFRSGYRCARRSPRSPESVLPLWLSSVPESVAWPGDPGRSSRRRRCGSRPSSSR